MQVAKVKAIKSIRACFCRKSVHSFSSYHADKRTDGCTDNLQLIRSFRYLLMNTEYNAMYRICMHIINYSFLL